MNEILFLVVPCYNEEEVLPETARRLGDKLAALTAAGKISPDSRVLWARTSPGTGGTRTPCWPA